MDEQPQHRQKKLVILMISLHGLVRGYDLELGRDADTGGQVTYVVELARRLGLHPAVERVDLLTRLVEDERVDGSYAQAEEPLGPGARIVRLAFGPKRYVRKELLWPHLDDLVDNCLLFIRRQGQLPDLIHSHYADAGYVGRQLSGILGVPLVHTGHSLGRPKRERLLASGRKPSAIERQFNLTRRISAEEDLLARASLIVTSTRQEVEEQYGLYDNADHGRFEVIPPGTDTSRFAPLGRAGTAKPSLSFIDRFLREPHKPMILALCRPDPRKNIGSLFTAYGEDEELQSLANLVVVAGNRDDISDMDASSSRVLSDMLLAIDRYDLWGKVAVPKHHRPEDVPDMYRLAVRRRGVFVNPALTEPFGLTLIEAAASGLPFVATEDGGPRDIVANCKSGVLVDPLDSQALAEALKYVLADRRRWQQFSRSGISGVRKHYSWNAHAEQYIKIARKVLHRNRKRLRRQQAFTLRDGKSPVPLMQYALISDIDNTLLGDRPSLGRLIRWLENQVGGVAFGIATGRSLQSAFDILEEWKVPTPNVMITSVGSEINHGPDLLPDLGYRNHIRYRWRRQDLLQALSGLPGLQLQPAENQREFKISFDVDPASFTGVAETYALLRQLKLHANLIYSHEAYLDILPVRASKGHAVRYLAYRWGLPLNAFLVAGDSGNDIEMMVGDTLGVVVGNHSPELAPLRGRGKIYFARGEYAQGILEGLHHYGLPGAA
ncbi:MAG: HAD-IIB family hydrolase [bacterium]|nr:HAD-IIB family hydrolase [bacterium]